MQSLVNDIAAAIRRIDASGVAYRSSKPPFREYQPGIGPYSETRLCSALIDDLKRHQPDVWMDARTARFPDILVPNHWAIELKIARPFGDNAKEAEHWSQNLLHPYAGNVSSLADAMKLLNHNGPEQRVVVVIGYEHAVAKVPLEPLVRSFELIATQVLSLPLGRRFVAEVSDLMHPVHQVARVYAWAIAAEA